MKKLLIPLVALLAINGTMAQTCVPCLPQGIHFYTQSQIDSFQTNYPGCTEIIGDVVISANVHNLIGLNTLNKVDGDIVIYFIDYLRNFNGLNRLNIIGGDFEIWANDSLISCSGLDSLTTVLGNFSIGKRGGSFAFGNHLLNSLSGLESLKTIEGELFIGLNDSLKNIEELSGLTSIGALTIYSNASLTSLEGINNIDANSISTLYIFNNPMLSYCTVKSICDYLASPNGWFDIDRNGTGCKNQYDVEDSCAAIGIESLNPESSSMTIYPNPASTTITIETPTKGSLSILNLGSQELLQREITELITTIDVSESKSGVYFVRILGEKTVQVGKFIKQ